MEYLLLIYGDESQDSAPEGMTPEMMQPWIDLGAALEAAGAMREGGAQLQPSSQAVSVRVRDGEPRRTDGPLADTGEQLGGLYRIECDTLDEAVAWAAKVPAATSGTIEVRPIVPPWSG
jgi:hypothetical protein